MKQMGTKSKFNGLIVMSQKHQISNSSKAYATVYEPRWRLIYSLCNGKYF